MPVTQLPFWGRWDLVIISIAVHLGLFLLFIGSAVVGPKRPTYMSRNIFIAFTVSLYFEMYGVPLTLYLAQPLISRKLGLLNFYPIPTFLRVMGSILILIGFILIYLGWRKIHYSGINGEELVTDGIYAKTRNPQYLGLLILTFGQFFQWPTISSLILWPVLALMYYRLAIHEEKFLRQRFGDEFEVYKARVPRIMPKLFAERELVARSKSF